MPTLKELVTEGASLAAIVQHLEGLPNDRCVAEAMELGSKEQQQLYALAKDAEVIALEQLVPQGQLNQAEVFEGRNSLPLYSRFQKRFFRQSDGRIFGNNTSPTEWLIGPGYFEVLPSTDQSRGALLIDYSYYPKQGLADWRPVVDNRKGASRFVYGGLQDYCRKVTDDLYICWVFRDGKDQGKTFVLARNKHHRSGR